MSIDSLVADGDRLEEGNFDDLILGDNNFTLRDVLRILETRSEIVGMALDDERMQQIIDLEIASAFQRILGGEGLKQGDRDKMNSKEVFKEAKLNAETQMRIEQEFESLAWNKNNDSGEYSNNYMRVIEELYGRIPEASFTSPLSGGSGFSIQHIKDQQDRSFNLLFISGEEILFDSITSNFYMMRDGKILQVNFNYIYCSTFGKNHPFGR